MHFLDMFFKTVGANFGVTNRAFLQANIILFPMNFFDMFIQARPGDQRPTFRTAGHTDGNIFHTGRLGITPTA